MQAQPIVINNRPCPNILQMGLVTGHIGPIILGELLQAAPLAQFDFVEAIELEHLRNSQLLAKGHPHPLKSFQVRL